MKVRKDEWFESVSMIKDLGESYIFWLNCLFTTRLFRDMHLCMKASGGRIFSSFTSGGLNLGKILKR